MSKSNIIVRVRYKKDINFQKLVSGWCNYVSKDGADGKSLRNLSSINEMYEKELGIYDDTKENEESYIWSKNGDINKKEIIKELPKEKSGRMWNVVISFPPDFANEQGLKTKQDYYLMTKSIIPNFILDNDMDLTNTKWYASLHLDTDNPHLHINLFEVEQRRKKDTLDRISIKHLKSNISSYLIDNTEFYKEQDYLFLGLDKKIRKSNFTKMKSQLFFNSKFRKSLNKDLLTLYDKLPKRGRLQYNSKNLDYCREDINKIIEKILYHDTIKYEFEKYYHSLEELQREQQKIYGKSKDNKYVQNKINRLYSKIGNDILYNFKVYNSKDFLLNQKEFLKINIMNMNFVSRNIKKKSTIIRHATDLYKLGKLASLSDNDIKKLLSNWLKKSKINYDVDLIFSAVSSTKDTMNATDFYKALSHLGYSKNRYDNLKNKSFYKNVRFKQFIKKANRYLMIERKKEEQYLLEILEKELKGRDI